MSHSFANSALGEHLFNASHNKILTADALKEMEILMANYGVLYKFVSCLYQVKEAVYRLLLLSLSGTLLFWARMTFCC